MSLGAAVTPERPAMPANSPNSQVWAPHIYKMLRFFLIYCSWPDVDGRQLFRPFLQIYSTFNVQADLVRDRVVVVVGVVTRLNYITLIFCSPTIILVEKMCVRSNSEKLLTQEKGSDKIIFQWHSNRAFKPEARVSHTGRSDDCNKRSEEAERCTEYSSNGPLIVNLKMYFLPRLTRDRFIWTRFSVWEVALPWLSDGRCP